MQLIQLERDDWNFFCPSTGQPVSKDTGEPNVAIQDAADESVDVVAFLKSVDQPGWAACENTSCGMACGPVCSTTWTVLDLS